MEIKIEVVDAGNGDCEVFANGIALKHRCDSYHFWQEAAGVSKKVLSSYYETVEVDRFKTYYFGKKLPCQIDIDRVAEQIKKDNKEIKIFAESNMVMKIITI